MAFPTPTAVTGTTPYYRGVTSHVIIVPSIANPASPTSSEVTAGTDYTAQIMSVTGFELSQANLDLNLAGNGYTGSVGGRTTSGECSIMFELSSAGPMMDIRSKLLPQSLQYVLFANEGFATGMSMDVWSVRIGSYSPPQDLEAIGGVSVPMFSYRYPSLNVPIPTS